MTSQIEEVHRARHGEGTQSFHALLRLTTLTKSPFAHQPGSSLIPVPLGFYGAFITYAQLIKSLAKGDPFNSQPLCLPGDGGVRLKISAF